MTFIAAVSLQLLGIIEVAYSALGCKSPTLRNNSIVMQCKYFFRLFDYVQMYYNLYTIVNLDVNSKHIPTTVSQAQHVDMHCDTM